MIIELSKIRIDGKTQPRVSISNETIAAYSEVLDDGGEFPPVKLFFDGADYWLADGFHRYHAHNKSGHTQIDGDVTEGTRQDAFVYSLGANYNHGLPRTIEDKRKSVTLALAEFKNISARQIANICKVSHTFVQRVQKSLEIVQKEKQPVPPPAPKPPPPPPPDEGDHDLAAEMQSLVDENNELRDQLMVKQSTIKETAKEEVSRTIKELRDRIRQLELELESVTKSRNEYQNKAGEAIKQVAYWKRRAEKAEKV
jgi:uncharacterized ParB-like nuclease family protein